jgi:hypothetical protein
MPADDQDLAPVIRLDDAFVRGARFTEGSADERRRQSERERRRAEKKRAKRIRRQWRPRRRLEPKDFVVPALAVVAALYVFKLGPFRPAARPSLGRAGSAAATPAPGETTSSTFTLQRLSYRPGDCVRWDQRKDGPGTRDTDVVPCAQPHLIEITGRAVAPDGPAFPTDSEWNHIVHSGDCAAQAKAYVGGGLDPYGRFGVGAIRPTLLSWNVGDREMWCGLEAQSQAADHDPDVTDAFTGTVHSQPQAMLWPTGSCLGGQAGTGAFDGIVPCSAPHLYEIAGVVNAAPRFTTPPPASSNLWNTRLGNDCDKVARARFGGRLPAGVQTAIFPIDPASWAAGRRTTECAAGRFDPKTNEPTTLTAPLALQQKAVSG